MAEIRFGKTLEQNETQASVTRMHVESGFDATWGVLDAPPNRLRALLQLAVLHDRLMGVNFSGAYAPVILNCRRD